LVGADDPRPRTTAADVGTGDGAVVPHPDLRFPGRRSGAADHRKNARQVLRRRGRVTAGARPVDRAARGAREEPACPGCLAFERTSVRACGRDRRLAVGENARTAATTTMQTPGSSPTGCCPKKIPDEQRRTSRSAPSFLLRGSAHPAVPPRTDEVVPRSPRETSTRSTEVRARPGRVSIRSPQKPRRRRCCGTRTSDRSAARLPACLRKQAEAWPPRSGRVSPPAPLLRRCPIHRLLCCIHVVLGLDDLSCAPPNRVARRRNHSLLRRPIPRASRPVGFNSSDGGFRASNVPAKLSV
jgi:hypothetical protein